MEIWQLLLFAAVNLMATTLSGVSGGGAALISTPFLVHLGLSPATAIATSKFSGLGISLGTSSRFFTERITNKKAVALFTCFGIIGSIIGSLLLVELSAHQALLQKLLGIAILIVGIPLLYLKNLGLEIKKPSSLQKTVGFLLLILGVTFQVVLGAGLGILQMIIFMGFFGMTALTANALKRVMSLSVATVSLVILIFVGLVNYKYGIVSLITSFTGGYLGAHIAIKKGDKFIKNALAITSGLLALQLLINN